MMMFVKPVLAVCPVCMVAVGGSLALGELLGIDDLIVAIWIGAFTASIAFWMADKFRLIKLPKPQISWPIIFYLMTLSMLYLQGKIKTNPYCQIWGIDKVFLGVTIGMVAFCSSVFLDQLLRKKNKNKGFFPFQKVVIPLIIVAGISLILLLTVC